MASTISSNRADSNNTSQLCDGCASIEFYVSETHGTLSYEVKNSDTLLTLRERSIRASGCDLCRLIHAFIKAAGVPLRRYCNEKLRLASVSKSDDPFIEPEHPSIRALTIYFEGEIHTRLVSRYPALSQPLSVSRPSGMIPFS